MDLICSLATADWISIINLILTSIIGIWIGRTVQGSLATNRGLKDHYIEEIKNLNKDYNQFMDTLYGGEKSSKSAQEWFKIMNIKLETIEQSMHFELIVNPEVLQNHVILKQFVTGTTEFNALYNQPNLVISPLTKNNIFTFHRNINNAFVRLIVDVNKAKKR